MTPSHALTSAQSKRVGPNHGKVGYIALQVTVSPEVKDALIELATENKSWVIDEVREAIGKHLDSAGIRC